MFPLPLVVTLGDSRQMHITIAAAHFCSAIAILLAAIAPLYQGLGIVLLLLNLIYWRRPAQSARLRANRDGKLQFWHDKQWRTATLKDSSVILPFCTVLRIAVEKPRLHRTIVVMLDSLPADDFRRLRVWLRWRGNKPNRPETPEKLPDQ